MDSGQLLISVILLSSLMSHGGAQVIPDFSSQCFAIGEVIFMVDGSDSILDVDFQRQKDFVLTVANSLYLSKVNGMRVGCIAFSTQIHGVPLIHSSGAHLFERAVDALPHDRDGTETHSGIQYARTIFKEEARPNVPKILVILTDGFSQKPSLTIKEAVKAKEENITIITVGIGRQNKGIAKEAMDELVTIASSPDLTFKIKGFNTLLSWAPNVTQTVCEIASTETVPLLSGDFFCPNVGEIMFMVDGSDSMLDINFAQEKNFVLSVVDSLYLDPVNGIRVGGLAFSSRVQGIPLDPFQNASEFRNSFGGLIHDQESTFTHLGIEYARGIFKSQAREGIPKTLVILTDGFSRRPQMTTQQAEDAKLEDITIVVVGIGRAILETSTRSRGELENIASSQDLLYLLPDFESLDPLVSNFTQTLCDLGSFPAEIAPPPTIPLPSVTVNPVLATTAQSALIVGPQPILPNPGTLTDCAYPADLMFMVDGSDSMLDINFQQEKDFVLSIVDSLYLNPADGIRVGGLAFSSRVQGIPLRPFLNASEFKREFGRLIHDQESTSTHLGIQYARDIFRQQARQGIPKVLILLTDGYSRRPQLTAQEAAQAKQEGISIITVGIGSGNRDVGGRAIQELDTIASSTEFVYLVQDFNELPLILFNVTSAFCDVIVMSSLLPPPQPPTVRIPPPTIASPPPTIASTLSPARIPTAPRPDCRYQADLMFMVDGSDSMLDINFQQEKDFVLSIVDSLYLNPADGIRVGGLAFSSRVQGIPLRPFLNASEFKREFGRLVHDQESTSTHLGIRYARDVFRQQGRSGARKVLVLLTDGFSRRPQLTAQEAALAKQEGISIMVVGIGSGNRDIGARALRELETIASSTDDVYLVQNFNGLTSILFNLTSNLCNTIALPYFPPAPRIPSPGPPNSIIIPPITTASPLPTTRRRPLPNPVVPRPDCRYPAELMFMVDGSDSMLDINFQQEKDFVLSIVDSLYLNPADGIRVGGLAFSSRVQGIPLRPFLNASEFKREFGRLVHDQESTSTHLGIRYARDVFRQQGTSGARKVLVLLTDGFSRRPQLTAQEAALAKQEGISIMVVGIGSGNRDIGARALRELETIASSTDDVYLVQNFNGLTSILFNLTSNLCNTIALPYFPPAPRIPSPGPPNGIIIPPITTASPLPTTRRRPLPNPVVPRPDCRYPAELMFMVDGSDSMLDINFQQEKDFVLSIVDSLYLNPSGGIRVGGLAFSSRVQGIPLRPFLNASEFKREFGRLVHDQESTSTHLGIQYARDIFRQQARQGVPKMLIILTDGFSRRPQLTAQEAAQAKQEGISIITVGINPAFSGLRERQIRELETLASSVDHVFQVPDFDKLSSFGDTVTNSLCDTLADAQSQGPPALGVDRTRVDPPATIKTVAPTVSAAPPAPTLKPSQPRLDCLYPAEVMFVLGGSDAMLQAYFDQEKNFILSVAESFYLNPSDGMRVGAVSLTYGLQGIPLDPFRDVANLRTALDRFTFVLGQQPDSLDLGIEFAREIIGAQGRNRVAKILVILTDDLSSFLPRVVQQAAEAKQEGIEIIVIGVGSEEQFGNRDRGQGFGIASGDDFVFRPPNFTGLPGILTNVTEAICVLSRLSAESTTGIRATGSVFPSTSATPTTTSSPTTTTPPPTTSTPLPRTTTTTTPPPTTTTTPPPTTTTTTTPPPMTTTTTTLPPTTTTTTTPLPTTTTTPPPTTTTTTTTPPPTTTTTTSPPATTTTSPPTTTTTTPPPTTTTTTPLPTTTATTTSPTTTSTTNPPPTTITTTTPPPTTTTTTTPLPTTTTTPPPTTTTTPTPPPTTTTTTTTSPPMTTTATTPPPTTTTTTTPPTTTTTTTPPPTTTTTLPPTTTTTTTPPPTTTTTTPPPTTTTTTTTTPPPTTTTATTPPPTTTTTTTPPPTTTTTLSPTTTTTLPPTTTTTTTPPPTTTTTPPPTTTTTTTLPPTTTTTTTPSPTTTTTTTPAPTTTTTTTLPPTTTTTPPPTTTTLPPITTMTLPPRTTTTTTPPPTTTTTTTTPPTTTTTPSPITTTTTTPPPTTTTTTTSPPTTATTMSTSLSSPTFALSLPKCTEPAEVMFLIDTSDRLSRPAFSQMKEFVLAVVDSLVLNELNGMRVGAGFYGFQVQGIPLNPFRSANQFRSAISDVRQSAEFPSTDFGIQYARDTFRSQSRSGLPKILIVLASALQRDPETYLRQGEEAKNEGVTIIVVGFGSGRYKLDGVTKQYLEELASVNSLALFQEDFTSLPLLLPNITDILCDTARLGVSSPTSTTSEPPSVFGAEPRTLAPPGNSFGVQVQPGISSETQNQRSPPPLVVVPRQPELSTTVLPEAPGTSTLDIANPVRPPPQTFAPRLPPFVEQPELSPYDPTAIPPLFTEQITVTIPVPRGSSPLPSGRLPPPNIDCVYPGEVMFMIDGSDSLITSDFIKEKEFVSSVLARFYFNENDGIRAGGIAYSSLIQSIPLDPFQSREQFRESFDRLVHQQESTYTHLGIQTARDIFQRQARTGLPKVLVILTDGLSRFPDRTFEEATKAKQEGILIITVGVASRNAEFSREAVEELRSISSSEALMFLVQSFDDLPSVEATLVQIICDLIKPPPTPGPTLTPPTVPRPSTTPTPVTTKSTFSASRCQYPVDLVFLLDGSAGSTEVSLLLAREFVLLVADSFYLNDMDGARVAGVLYDTEIQSVPFSPFQNSEAFQTRMRSLSFNPTVSYIDKGIDLARRMFAEQGREGIPKVLIIVRDGYSSLPLDALRQALIARTQDITVVTVGRRGNSGVIQGLRQELESIASSPDLFYGVGDFIELQSVGSQLVADVCDLISPLRTLPTTRLVPQVTRRPTTVPMPTSTLARTTRGPVFSSSKCAYPGDLIFLLDGSETTTPLSYLLAREFVLAVTDSFNIDRNEGTRVAGIMYQSVIQSIPFEPFQDAAAFQSRMRLLPFNSSVSFVDEGISYARKIFTEEGREGIPKVLVIVRDGYSSLPADTLRQSLIARSQNIAVVAVGLVSNSGVPTRQELQSIASTPGLFIGVRDFTELQPVGSELATKLCDLISPPPGLPTVGVITPEFSVSTSQPPLARQATTPVPHSDLKCHYPGDLIFLLDGSPTSTDLSSLLAREFVLSTADAFDLNEFNGTRVASVMNDGNMQSVRFVPFHNSATFQTKLRSVYMNSSITYADRGIERARKMFSEEGRTGVAQVLVILRDGFSPLPPDTLRQALIARTQNITVIAIGLDGNSGGTPGRRQELQSMASSPDLFYGVSSFGDLPSVRSQVVSDICELLSLRSSIELPPSSPLNPTQTPVLVTTTQNIVQGPNSSANFLCRHPGDVVFILDGSKGVDEIDFSFQTDFVKRMSDLFYLNPDDGLRIGVVVYGDQIKVVQQEPFLSHSNLQSVLGLLTHDRGSPLVDAGIRYGRELLNQQGRSGVPKVIVLLSHGTHARPVLTTAEAERAKQEGSLVITVGIGRDAMGLSADVIAELRSMASTHDLAFLTPGYSQLPVLVNNLAPSLCDVLKTTDSFIPTTLSTPTPSASEPPLPVTSLVDPVTPKAQEMPTCTKSSAFQVKPGHECAQPAEVVFMVDASETITPEKFALQKEFVMCVANSLFLDSANGARVAAIAYNSHTQSIPLALFSGAQKFWNSFSRMVADNSTALTNNSIQVAREMFSSDARPGVPKMLIILTDGKNICPGNTLALANLAKRENILIISIGISKTPLSSTSISELKSLASTPEHAFVIPHFQSLMASSGNLVHVLCNNLSPGSRPNLPVNPSLLPVKPETPKVTKNFPVNSPSTGYSGYVPRRVPSGYTEVAAAQIEVPHKESEELPMESPQESEFVSDAFTDNHLNEDDLRKEMQQLGMQEEKDESSKEESDIPEWEQELQKELQEYEVVSGGIEDEDLENEILQQLEEEERKEG